jgi:hypothetical protein
VRVLLFFRIASDLERLPLERDYRGDCPEKKAGAYYVIREIELELVRARKSEETGKGSRRATTGRGD